MDEPEIPTNVICPSCKTNGKFILDQSELIYLGYSKDEKLAKTYNLIFVEIGICIGACTFEIINEDGDERPKYNSTGTELIIDDYSDEGFIQIDNMMTGDEIDVQGGLIDNFGNFSPLKVWAVQTEYASSVDSDLGFLDPPFHVPRKAMEQPIRKLGTTITEEMLRDNARAISNQASKDNENTQQKKYIAENKATSLKYNNLWINQLCGVLLELKRSRTKVKGGLQSDEIEKELEIQNELMAHFNEMKESGYPGLDTSQIKVREDYGEDLENSIGELKLKLRSKKRVPIAKMELIFSAYMHKTTSMGNVEPWWVYLKRLKINNRSIENTLRNWHPTENIPSFNKKVKKLSNVSPTINTVKSFHAMIRAFCHTVDLSGQEFEDLLQESLNIIEILESTKWGDSDQSIANVFFSYGHYKLAKLDFGIGENVHAPGFVEAICIEGAAKRCLSKLKATELSETYLFPNPTDPDTWWKNSLSNDAILQFNNREATMNYLGIGQ